MATLPGNGLKWRSICTHEVVKFCQIQSCKWPKDSKITALYHFVCAFYAIQHKLLCYDSDDDYYYYYYIIVDLYIALENIFKCLADVSSFLHILLQIYTIPEQYTCTGSRFSGQFVYFHHHDKPISVSHDMSQTGSVAIWLHNVITLAERTKLFLNIDAIGVLLFYIHSPHIIIIPTCIK